MWWRVEKLQLTASAPQMSSPSREARWGRAAGPPPGSCSAPESDEWAYLAGTVRQGPLYPRPSASLHFQSQCCLNRRGEKNTKYRQTNPELTLVCAIRQQGVNKDKINNLNNSFTIYISSSVRSHPIHFFGEVQLSRENKVYHIISEKRCTKMCAQHTHRC